MSDPQQQQRDAAFLAATVTAVTALIVAKAAEAQLALLGGFAKLIARYGVGDLLLFSMRKQAGTVAATWQASVPELARQVVDQAAADGGGNGGGSHTPKFGVAGDSYESHAERSARAIREDLAGKLNQIGYRLTRYADDVYRAVLADTAQAQVLGLTPAQAQHEAYRKLVREGVTGFVDTKGRNWELSAYVEMATRTAGERAFNVSHLDRMQSLGLDLFTVPDDGHPCPLCLPWQGKILSVLPDSRADATLAEATAAGLFHPNCFPGFVPVSAPSAIRAADSRWYDGEIVVINTAAGNELTVTPNHPILTPGGWVAAGELVVGQDLIRHNVNVERVDGMGPDKELVEARISDVYHALRESSGVTTVTVPSSAEQFHGDGGNGDVEVVLVDGPLKRSADAADVDGGRDGALFVGGVRFADLVGDGTLDELGVRLGLSSDGLVGVGGESLSLCGRHAAEAAAHGLAEVGSDASVEEPLADFGLGGAESLSDFPLSESGLAQGYGLVEPCGLATSGDALSGDARGVEPIVDDIDADAEGGRQLARFLSASVSPDQIVSVERRDFSGHVYNLQTSGEWYVASSIVAHNCRHVLVGFIPGVTEIPEPHEWTAEDAARYAESQYQRRLEREIRAAKRELAAAFTPEMRSRALLGVRRAQARMRDFIAQSGRVRNTRREHLDLGAKV